MTSCGSSLVDKFTKASKTYLSRRKKVLPGESSKGFVIVASSPQSVVRQTLTDLSSDYICRNVNTRQEARDLLLTCVAKNWPTGSHVTPLTNPWCLSSLMSGSRYYSWSNKLECEVIVRDSDCDVPRLYPLQIITFESSPTEARYRSSGAHARSVTSVYQQFVNVRRARGRAA